MRERPSILTVALTAVALRAWLTFAFRIDSDEPQHLHVAWAWSRGLVQYRDVFDNHLPLLHIAFAPFMAIAPESSAVFAFMRLAIAPLAIACSVVLFVLARPLYGTRNALAAALLFSVMPPWLPKSVEFRNDTLWILSWLIGLALLCRARGAAHFAAGVAFGLSLLASIKTGPLLIAHVIAWAVSRRPVRIRDAASIAAGIALPCAVLAAAMSALGALDAMVYCVLRFNLAAPVDPLRRLTGAVAFALFLAVTLVRRPAGQTAGHHFAHFAFWYVALLLCFWPILTPRDFLPVVPLAALGIALHFPERKWSAALATCTAAGVIATCIDARIWRPRDDSRERLVDAVARITTPADPVLDLKGDAVFRRRPVYFIYEDVGRALTAAGAIPDRGPEDIVARRCCVAIADTSHLPPRTREFLNRNFIDVGGVRVCGTRTDGRLFRIAVPRTYAVITRDPRRLLLDGRPYLGPRLLDAGLHTLSTNGETVTVVWSRAAEEAR